MTDQTGPIPERPSRWVIFLVLAPIIALTIVANIGARTWTAVLPDNPALALAMNPTNIVMAAASPMLGTAEFYGITLLRRLIIDPLYVLLGVWFGHAAVNWLKRKSRDIGPLAEKFEEWFPRYGWLLILLNPSALILLMAGSSGMRMRKIMALDFIGTLVTAFGIRQLGWKFTPQINGFVGFLDRNQKFFLILSGVLLLIFVFQLFTDKDKASVAETEHQLEAEADAEASGRRDHEADDDQWPDTGRDDRRDGSRF